MTFDIGPLLEMAAPLSILGAAVYGFARVLSKQDEHGRDLKRLLTMFSDLESKHDALDRRVTEQEFYERGMADAQMRRRVTQGRSRTPRSRR